MKRKRLFCFCLLMTLGMPSVPVFPQMHAPADQTDPKAPESSGEGQGQTQKSEAASNTGKTGGKLSIQSTNNHLISLNFVDVDIREALSAIALEREINIATAQDVTGKISVHVYKGTLREALEAICLAGGVTYTKQGHLYYVYKPKEFANPSSVKPIMRVFRLKYAEVSKIQEILDAVPGMRMIKVHEPSRTIIVEDTPENIDRIETIIRCWDSKPTQVLIEAKILEIELTDDMSLGVDWGKILGDVRLQTGSFSRATLPTTGPISPVPSIGTGVFSNIITGAGTAHQFAAALDALQTKTRINTLSTPKVLAINGKPARVQVGGQQGYRVTTVSNGIATETINFIDTGTILDITPYIADNDNILLYVKPSIDAARIEEGGIPVVKTTTVATSLLAKNGETVFIGGLIQDTKTNTRDMVPCLGGIPGLGALFGRTFRGIGKSELVVLISPRVIDGRPGEYEKEALEKTRKIEENFAREPLSKREQLYDFFLFKDYDEARENK